MTTSLFLFLYHTLHAASKSRLLFYLPRKSRYNGQGTDVFSNIAELFLLLYHTSILTVTVALSFFLFYHFGIMFADKMYTPKHIHDPVLQSNGVYISIQSRLSLNKNFSPPNVTHPGYMKISYYLALTGWYLI